MEGQVFGLFKSKRKVEAEFEVKSSDVNRDTVFQEGTYPELTFVDRTVPEITQLKALLTAGGQIICISGQSKVGKTVTCQNLIGKERVKRIGGGGINSYDQFIGLLAGELGIGISRTISYTEQQSSAEASEFKADLGGGVAGISAQVGVSTAQGSGTASVRQVTETVQGHFEHTVYSTLCNQNVVLIVDDFHRIDEGIRERIVNSAKDYLVDGRFILVLISIPTHCFDPVKSNPELIGRYVHIEIPRWRSAELMGIAKRGFGALDWPVEESVIKKMARFSYGNPLLMQAMCNKAQQLAGKGSFQKETGVNADRVMSKLVEQYAPLFDAALQEGSGQEYELKPRKGRGKGKSTLKIKELVMLAASEMPFNHQFSIANTITPKANQMIKGKSVRPVDVAGAFATLISRLNKTPSAIFLEMDEATVFIRHPYLRFYLQWGLRQKFGFNPADE